MFERMPVADRATMEKLRDFMAADRDLPETAIRMRYLILSQVRTGGSFLCEALERSRHAGMPFEYLNPAAILAFAKRIGAGTTVSLQRLISELEKRRTGANGVFGLQIHVEQLSKPLQSLEQVSRWLRRFHRIVMLYRRDKLAQAVSLERSIQSSVWFQEAHETGERNPTQWTIDPWVIARHVANLGQQEQLIRTALESFTGPVIELTYEELDTEFDTAWRRVSDFLDIPPIPTGEIYPRLARMRDATSEEMMARFLAALRDSDLARDPEFATIAAAGKVAR